MARHNREGYGVDQLGLDYRVSYQPDWLGHVKVTRSLGSGRQSTKGLFRNPDKRQRPPGRKIRTRVSSPGQDLDFGVTLDDPGMVVRRVMVEVLPPGRTEDNEVVVFTLQEGPGRQDNG